MIHMAENEKPSLPCFVLNEQAINIISHETPSFHHIYLFVHKIFF